MQIIIAVNHINPQVTHNTDKPDTQPRPISSSPKNVIYLQLEPPNIVPKGHVQGQPCWSDAKHVYIISDEKLARLNLSVPTNSKERETFYKQHADTAKERERNVPIVRTQLPKDFDPKHPRGIVNGKEETWDPAGLRRAE